MLNACNPINVVIIINKTNVIVFKCSLGTYPIGQICHCEPALKRSPNEKKYFFALFRFKVELSMRGEFQRKKDLFVVQFDQQMGDQTF